MIPKPCQAQKRRFLLCFSSKDAAGKAALVAHLAPARGSIAIWSIDEVPAGEQIMPEFLRVASDADSALLLLSADFFAEMATELFAEQIAYLRQQHNERGLPLIPLLWRDCNWKAVDWLAELMLLPVGQTAIQALDMAQQDRALADVVRHLDGRKTIANSHQKSLLTRKLNSRLTVAVTVSGMLLLLLAGGGAGISVSNYHSMFVAIGALGGLYLLFGLFFANILMFTEKQRPRMVALLVVALILVTLILGARAARCFLRAHNELTKNSNTTDTSSLRNLRLGDPRQPDLLQPQSDPLPKELPPDLDSVQSAFDMDGPGPGPGLGPGPGPGPRQDNTTPTPTPTPRLDERRVENSAKIQPAIKNHVSDMGLSPSIVDLLSDSMNVRSDGAVLGSIMPKYIPEILIRSEITEQETPHLPDKVKDKFICREVSGIYQIYLDTNGSVSDVKIISAIPEADADIMATIQKWKYKPQQQPVYFARKFKFFIDDGQGCKTKVVPAILIKKDKISINDDPHLSDFFKWKFRGKIIDCSYKVCIGLDGNIIDVQTVKSVDQVSIIEGENERIIEKLKTWKYKPQSIPICFIQFLEFHIE